MGGEMFDLNQLGQQLDPALLGQFRSQLVTGFGPDEIAALMQGGGLQALQGLLGGQGSVPFAFQQGAAPMPISAQGQPLTTQQITATGQQSAAPSPAMLSAMTGTSAQVSPAAILQALAQMTGRERERQPRQAPAPRQYQVQQQGGALA